MTAPTPSSTKQTARPFPVGTDCGPADTADAVHKLIELLQRQRGLYEQLRGLGHQQGQLIESGSPQSLLAVLSQRQQLVDDLADISGQLEPYRDRWEAFWGGLSEPDRHQIGALVGALEGLLAGIIDQDDQDRKRLEQSKAVVGHELGRVTQTGAALQAYRNTPPPSASRFTDQQG